MEQRDHRYYFLKVDGKVTDVQTKVSQGSNYKDLGPNLVNRMSRQMGLTKRQFKDFVQCTVSGSEYVEILRVTERLVE